MKRVFLDANIFFAAVKSQTGGSHFIIELAKQGELEMITVIHALAEAEHNIREKIGAAALQAHYENLLRGKPIIRSLIGIPEHLETKAALYVPEKDVPIIVGAIMSKGEALITLDKKHFLSNAELYRSDLNVVVMTPGEFLRTYKEPT